MLLSSKVALSVDAFDANQWFCFYCVLRVLNNIVNRYGIWSLMQCTIQSDDRQVGLKWSDEAPMKFVLDFWYPAGEYAIIDLKEQNT